MITNYNIIDSILFSESLAVIEQRLQTAKKDQFDHNDRIVIDQDVQDQYPYVDSAGAKLIEIQKIINRVDISNCFILLITANQEIQSEIDFVTKFYSIDPIPINFVLREGEYQRDTMQYDNTACKKLWDHLYIGTDGNVNPCCLADHRFPLGNINQTSIDDILHSIKANQIRDWMKQGFKTVACSTCYLKEDSQIASSRQACDASIQKLSVDSLDIRLDNICNFKCRMCSEYFSSAIQQETIELYGDNATTGHEPNQLIRLSIKEKNTLFSKIKPYITADIKKIYFAGGEPLITNEHYKILDHLLEIGNTNLEISYNTNLSMLKYKSYDVLDYWRKFQKIKVGASIDASGPVAEYVRHGTVWDGILTNINDIRTHAANVHLMITSTVSFLTIENLISLQTLWINDSMFTKNDFRCNVLVAPAYLSPAALPQHHKQRLTNMIKKHIDWLGQCTLADQWQDILQFMNNNDYTHTLNDFRHRTLVLDSHRGESFMDVFPEFSDLYT